MKKRTGFFGVLFAILFALGANVADVVAFTQPTQQWGKVGDRALTGYSIKDTAFTSRASVGSYDSSLFVQYFQDGSGTRSYIMVQQSNPAMPIPAYVIFDAVAMDTDQYLTVSFLDSSGTSIRNAKTASPESELKLEVLSIGQSDHFSTYSLSVPSPTGAGQFTSLRLNISTINAAPSGSRRFFIDNMRFVTTAGDTILFSSFEYVKLPSGATLVSPPNSSTGMPQTLTLTFNKGQRTDSALVVVTDTVGPVSSTVVKNGDTTLVLNNLALGKLYFWKVINKNVASSGPDSPTWSFRTAYAPLLPPTIPIWDKPADGAINIPLNQRFTVFGDFTAGISHKFQLWDSTGAVLIKEIATTDTSVVADSILAHNTLYKYRAEKIRNGFESGWTTMRTFRTVHRPPPPTPTIILPTVGAIVNKNNLRIVVRRNGLRDTTVAFNYEWWSPGSSITGTTISDTVFVLSGIAYGTTYSARVRAVYTAGDTASAWSPTVSFTTAPALPAPPPIPRLQSPLNGATNVSTRTAFSCSSATGVDSTRLQILINSTVIKDTTIKGGDTIIVNGLPTNTTVNWREKHINSVGQSDWSATWSFRTASVTTVLPIPVIVIPLQGDTIKSNITKILYQRISGISVQIQVSFATGQSPIIDSVIPSGDTLFCGLMWDSLYSVRARNVNGLEMSNWSAPTTFWSFLSHQTQTTLTTPILVGPSQDAVGLSPGATTLQWRISDQGVSQDSFDVEISETSLFSRAVVYRKTVGELQVIVSGLSGTTTYYWHVKRKNHSGVSEWSAVWNFRTVIVTGIHDKNEQTPTEFALEQNYPNPFNPTTTIEVAIPKAADVEINIYNILGQKVRALLREAKAPGFYSVQWDGRNDFGQVVSTGVYVYRLRAGSFIQTKKMMFVK